MQRYKFTLLLAICLVIATVTALPVKGQDSAKISGELKKWHKVTLTFTGPDTNEKAQPNPFLNYRLNVMFRKGKKQYIVPGYYAADGNAGQSSSHRSISGS